MLQSILTLSMVETSRSLFMKTDTCLECSEISPLLDRHLEGLILN